MWNIFDTPSIFNAKSKKSIEDLDSQNIVMFIGLNPSTATYKKLDPTVTRCANYAKAWGYDGFFMGNIYSYRATEPKNMLSSNEEINEKLNDEILSIFMSKADKVILAYGNLVKKDRLDEFFILHSKFRDKFYCLKRNKNGSPAHPLYLKADIEPTEYII